ncbi:MAG: cyclic nucleotide-binding protein [Sphingomonas bacterium]|jgi:CRP-like cAMP-binding protein|nr:cyclic nucleotide-binding protein [Sphingomonas bacterium]
MSSHAQSYTRNCLLSACSPEDFALLQPDLTRVELTIRQTLYSPNEAIEHVYFPEGGVGSIVARQDGGAEVEVGIFGREGMSGVPIVLGVDRTPHDCFIQVDSATALRINSGALLRACDKSRSLHRLLLAYVQCGIVQAAQTAASNGHNELPERLARWLLMCHDRVDADEIPLTHEFMGMMLSVRRSGVTVTLHALEASGAIRARRGLVLVTDRERLLEIAGDSYGDAEAEYRRLIGPFGK